MVHTRISAKDATAGEGGAHGVALATRPYAYRSLDTTWNFRLLHLAGLVMILPLIAAARMLPSHWRDRNDESVFVETNRVVLTALGFAFMA